MEVGVTGHNFESWPPKDHSCHVYWFQRRRLLNIFSIGSYVKIKSSHGGHLEFPISKRFTSLVQTTQWSFLQSHNSIGLVVSNKKIFKISTNQNTLWTWQPCWISDQCQKQKSCIWPSNEHFCQVWFKSALWFQKKRWKCEIPIGSNVILSRVLAAILNFRSANDSQV